MAIHQRQVLLKARNMNWIGKLTGLIKDKPTFIAVGVRHLPGENGLIALLQKEGYKVDPVEK
nr:TraB/GumN family protein [Bacteroides oleiciplenus]